MQKMVSEEQFLANLATADATELAFHFIIMSEVVAGWRCDDRVEDEHVLYFVLDGRIGGEAGGETVSVGADEVLWTPPLLPHSYRLQEERTRTYSLRFRLAVEGQLPVVSQRAQHLRQAEELRSAFDRVYRIVQEDTKHSFFRLRAAMVELMALLLERLASNNTGRCRRLAPSQWKRLETFFEREMQYAPGPAELAKVLGWNPDYFARRFREDLGISPREWLTRERLRRAAVLLVETRLPISEIAERTGYGDQRYFSRQFHASYSCTPSDYRRQH